MGGRRAHGGKTMEAGFVEMRRDLLFWARRGGLRGFSVDDVVDEALGRAFLRLGTIEDLPAFKALSFKIAADLRVNWIRDYPPPE